MDLFSRMAFSNISRGFIFANNGYEKISRGLIFANAELLKNFFWSSTIISRKKATTPRHWVSKWTRVLGVETRCGGKGETRGGKILFCESVIFKIFAWINFRESTIFRIFAWINFRESGPIRENKSTRKLIHAKINPTTVHEIIN